MNRYVVGVRCEHILEILRILMVVVMSFMSLRHDSGQPSMQDKSVRDVFDNEKDQ
ncbi:hypothetical protein D3C81_777550 [compost metagenome]